MHIRSARRLALEIGNSKAARAYVRGVVDTLEGLRLRLDGMRMELRVGHEIMPERVEPGSKKDDGK